LASQEAEPVNDVVPLLKHSPSAQDPAVLEEITVQREPLVASLVEAALDLESGPRHQLLVGSRGIGKTHILTLLAGRLRAEENHGPLMVAWLFEDPWAIRSYEKFLSEILARLGSDLEDPALVESAKEIRTGEEAAALRGEQLLRDTVADGRLILLVENLDEIFRRIGPAGQARFRAFAEDWRQMLIVATSPQLFEGVQLHESPFYGFFAVTHLEELSLASARELMRRIAELRGDAKLAEFLRTDTATRRLAAIEALAGGHPRVWLLLSGCVSIEAIDELVPLFLEALDDLTPYYQARLRELSDQQQEMVVLLGEAGGALNNRELAERSGLPQNQVATLVRQLDDRSYIRRASIPKEIAEGDERMSYWELREPLMRLCLDVKQSRGEPLRMVVEFLRAWYGTKLLDELAALPPSAELAMTYVTEALRSFDERFPLDDLFEGTPEEIVSRAERGLSLLPDRLELRLVKAAGLRMQGRLTEAEAEYEQLIAEEENEKARLSLRLQLYPLQLQNGKGVDEDGLAAQLLDLFERNPEDALTAELVGEGLATLRRYDRAVEVLPRALDLNPGNEDLLRSFSTTLVRLERDEEAVEVFHRLIEHNRADHLLHGRRGAALQRLGRHDEALESFQEAERLEPRDPRAPGSIGVTLTNLHRYEEALAALDRARELDPDDPKIESQRSIALRRAGRMDEALEALDRAIELDPEDAVSHERRGVILNALARHEQALEAFRRAEELDADLPEVHSNKGVALVRLGRHEEALDAFFRAHELDPQDVSIQGNLGGTLAHLGRHEEGLEALRAALDSDSDRPAIWNNLGSVLMGLERVEEALDAFRRAADLNSDDADIQNNLGIALNRLDRDEEAVEPFHRAIELRPERADAWANHGASLSNSGRYEEALDSFAEARRLAPRSPELLHAIGMILAALDRSDEALQAFTEASELVPEEPQYRFARAEIELTGGEIEPALDQLREALRLWSDHGGRPGDPEVVCLSLWRRHEAGEDVAALAFRLAQLYDDFGAAEELGRGLVDAIVAVASASASLDSARSWLAAWEAIESIDALAIPVEMLRAAVEWKKDRNRSHLLNLPKEQREILTGLLARTEDGP
jgi:tetratricopeptide (TPR) repeat protein